MSYRDATDALERALAEVYAGADSVDAACVADHLHDLGFEVVAVPRASRPRRVQRTVSPLPKSWKRTTG